MPRSFVTLLDQARADAGAFRSRPEGTSPNPLIADFLLDVYQIGLAIGGDPALTTSPELRSFLDDTVPDLETVFTWLYFYPGTLALEFQGPWEDDEWKQLCRRRSALQFFLDLYRDTTFGPFIDEVKTDDLDEKLRE